MMTSKNMQQVNPNRSITANVVFLVLVCSLVTFAVNAQCVSSQAKKAKGATSGYRDSLTNLMTIITRRGVRRRGAWFPAAARFDSINLLTEAAESILYWNGKTYRWEELAGQ